MSETVSLHHARMRYAIEQVRGWPDAQRKEITQRVKGLPVALRTQGLMVTVATLADGAQLRLAQLIAEWLLEGPRRRLTESAARPKGLTQRLLAACAAADRSSYMAAQAEALALMEHLKLYAEAWGSDR